VKRANNKPSGHQSSEQASDVMGWYA